MSTILGCALAACAADSHAASDAAWAAGVPARSIPPQAVAGETAQAASLLQDSHALVRWLIDHNADVAAQAARVEQARASADQSRVFTDPSADFTWGGINVGASNPPDLPWSDSQNFEFGVHETFEIGKRDPRIHAATLRLAAARARYVHVLGDKVHDARAALAREVYLKARLGQLEENLRAAQEMLAVERTRRDQGDLSGNDYDRLILDTTLIELEMPRTRAELDDAAADLRAILGGAYESAPAEISALGSGANLALEGLDIDAALETRADHQAIALEVEAAHSDAELAHARAIPDPTFGVAYTHDRLTEAGNQPDTLQLSVGINVPIFDRGQHDARKADNVAFELVQTRLQSLRDAQSDAASLLSKKLALDGVLKRMEDEALPKSKQVLDVTSAAFNRGELKLTDVLLARRTHIDLTLKHMDLQFETFNVRNDLRRVLGLDADLARGVATAPRS